MRYLIGLLLLANLGMLVWVSTQPQPQPERYRPVPVPPGIEPLVLLEERPASASRSDNPEPESEAGPADAGTETEARIVQTDIAPSAGPPSETPPVQPAGDEQSGDAEASSAAPAATPVCQTVGPFLKQVDATAISSRLDAQGYRASLRNGEVRNPAGYWVYMSAMPAAEARRIVAELDANGMTDYFIGKQNYISLGIFSGKSKARARLEQIEKLGYEAVLDRRYRTRTVHWVDVEQEEGKPLLGSALWEDIQSQHPDIRVQRISCE